MPKFELSKWYLDCVSPAGDVIVAYRAELRWGRIRLPYASVLFRPAGGAPTFQSAVRASLEPEQTGDTLSWAVGSLGFAGCWESLAESTSVSVYESFSWTAPTWASPGSTTGPSPASAATSR